MIDFILGAASASVVWMFFWPEDRPIVWIEMTKNVTHILKENKNAAPPNDQKAEGSRPSQLAEGKEKVEGDGAQKESCCDAGPPEETETEAEVLSWNAAWQETPVIANI